MPSRHPCPPLGLGAAFRRLALAAAVALAACGGDSSGPSLTLSISGYSGSLTFVGATTQLSVSSSGGGAVGAVTWSSADGGVASVSGSGLVTAVSAGSTTISAQAGGASTSVSVTVDPAPATLLSQGGDAQSGPVASALGTLVLVEVLDQGGTPIPGETVTFQASDGGSANPASIATDGIGVARTTWTLGTVSGVQTLQASSGGRSVTFTATAAPGAPVELLAESGNGQTGLAGVPLGEPIGTLVADQYGNGVPGVTVTFTPAAGSGSTSVTSVTSGAAGVAAVVWTPGRYAGEHSVTAAATNLGTTTFMATVLPNGVITGVATPTSGWYSSPAALALRATVAGTKMASDPLRLASSGRLAAGEAAAPAFPLPGADLLVRMRKPDGPVFAAAAASVGAAEAQAAALQALTRALPGSDRFEVRGVSPAIRTVRIEAAEGVDADALARTLAADPRVESVEPNGVASAFGGPGKDGPGPGPEGVPIAPTSEPLYIYQAWHYETIGLENAWKFTRGDPNVVVAVVDDGVRFDHPDLVGALLADGFDFVQDGGIPTCFGGQVGNAGDGDGPDPDPTTPMLYHFNQAGTCVESVGGTGGHGTHVSGTIGARDGTGGLVGVAPGVSILPVRVLGPHGSGSYYDIAQGILYAAGLPADGGTYGFIQNGYGAHVINLSLGGSNPNNALQAAVEAAEAAGSLVVASAGNAGNGVPNYPASYPATMSVSAVGPSWNRSGYSSYGSTVEIAAPGGGVGDSGGDPNHGVWSTTWDFDASQPHWEGWDGTSMAAPHVSGVAALLFSQDPGRSAAEVRSLLTTYARDLGATGRDIHFGYGLLDAVASLTQGTGVPGDTWLALFDAGTGAVVDVQPAAPGGAYTFGGLPDGDYFVYAGMDEFSDGFFGVASRPFSAFGGGSEPTPITVDGAGNLVRSFFFGRPLESEPNQNFATADRIMNGGYIEAVLGNAADVDFFRIDIAEAGTYRFETYGLFGACGFALVPDTVLHLHDDVGVAMTSADDIDTAGKLYCSRLDVALDPGTYYLRVSAYGSTGSGGTYGLWSGRLN